MDMLFSVVLPVLLALGIIGTTITVGLINQRQMRLEEMLEEIQRNVRALVEPPTRTCIRCLHQAPAGAQSCPNCGHSFL